MPKSLVGLLAAAAATMLAVAGFAPNLLRWTMILAGFATTWLAAWVSGSAADKKNLTKSRYPGVILTW